MAILGDGLYCAVAASSHKIVNRIIRLEPPASDAYDLAAWAEHTPLPEESTASAYNQKEFNGGVSAPSFFCRIFRRQGPAGHRPLRFFIVSCLGFPLAFCTDAGFRASARPRPRSPRARHN